MSEIPKHNINLIFPISRPNYDFVITLIYKNGALQNLIIFYRNRKEGRILSINTFNDKVTVETYLMASNEKKECVLDKTEKDEILNKIVNKFTLDKLMQIYKNFRSRSSDKDIIELAEIIINHISAKCSLAELNELLEVLETEKKA